MTLTEFLLARIAEDETSAREGADETTAEQWYADRMLAECEAKRRIVERETGSRTKITYRRMMVLQDLAAVYTDHPDYDDSWRP